MKNTKILSYLVIGAVVMSSITTEIYATGSISGNISDTSSGDISDAKVFAILDNSVVELKLTNNDGDYSITGLEAGTYEVSVEAGGYECRTVADVVVTDGQNTVVDFSNLAVEGVITGRVEEPDETTGIPNAWVSANDNDGFTRAAKTNSSGNYTINKLPAATFTVTVLYGVSAYDFTDNEDIAVTAGNTTSGVDFVGATAATGKISGTVTETNGTTAIEGANVIARNSSNKTVDIDKTDSNGDYELSALATGTYTVTAWRSTGGKIAEVSNVSVTNGQTTDQDLSAAGGSISGTVENSSQSPIQGAILTAIKDGKVYTATTDSSGDYTIQFLPAGDYQVTVDPNNNDYVASKIDDVTVVTDQETSNQDFTLGQDGKITGTVKDTSEVAIEGALVMAIEPDDAENDPDVAFIPTTTAVDGTYTIAHLRTSQDYIIMVSAEDYVSDSEEDVSVTAGQVTSGKNFTLGISGGTISGTVYESDGQTQIENAMVQCSCPGKSFASVMSDSNGDYSIALLQAGTYEVTAYAAGYEEETLSNVVVTGTGENSGNDFTLDDE